MNEPTFEELLNTTRDSYIAGQRKHVPEMTGRCAGIADAAFTLAGEAFEVGFRVAFVLARECNVPAPPFPKENSENSVNSVQIP